MSTELAAIWPDARFVVLVRDGRDVALSIMKVPFGANNVWAAARSWAHAIRLGREAARALPRPRAHPPLRGSRRAPGGGGGDGSATSSSSTTTRRCSRSSRPIARRSSRTRRLVHERLGRHQHAARRQVAARDDADDSRVSSRASPATSSRELGYETERRHAGRGSSGAYRPTPRTTQPCASSTSCGCASCRSAAARCATC